MTVSEREQIARIIDPNAWNAFDNDQENAVWGDVPRQVSLAKADQIITIGASDR